MGTLAIIIKSSDCKMKKWKNAKGIIKWIADKGVDVGIAVHQMTYFLPSCA